MIVQRVGEDRDTILGVTLACGGAGVLVMVVLQWHMAVHWVDLYAQYPMEGHKPEVVAKMAPDFLFSELSRMLAQVLVFVFTLIAMLVFPSRWWLAALSVLSGAWLVPQVSMLFTPGTFSSNLGPLAVLVHFILSAIYLGIGMIAGVIPGVGINWLRARLLQ